MLSMQDSQILRWLDGLCARSDTLTALRIRVADAWERLWDEPEARARTRRIGAIALGVVIVVGSAGAWLVLRPVPKPDYRNDSITRVLDYTFFTSEFNKLSVEERIRLVGMIRERIESMSGAESMLLAAFAAGIKREAREQLEENISRLVIDVWDMKARNYASIPADEQDSYLDGTFIEMYRLMETMSGEESGRTDSEILAEGRQQAQRDLERMREGEGPGARTASRLYSIMVNPSNAPAAAS